MNPQFLISESNKRIYSLMEQIRARKEKTGFEPWERGYRAGLIQGMMDEIEHHKSMIKCVED